MLLDDCDGFARALAVALNSVRVIKIERRIGRDIQRRAFLLNNFAIVSGRAEFFRAPLSLANSFPKIGPGAQAGRHESMKRDRVSHHDRRNYQQRREYDTGGHEHAPAPTCAHKQKQRESPKKHQQHRVGAQPA